MGKANPAAGVREAPPLMLLALVGQFLANNGFNSSARIFNTERKKRPKKEGWMGTLAKNYTASFPALEQIFKQWEEEHIKQYEKDDDSDDDSSDSDEGSAASEAIVTSRESKSDDSDSSSDSNVDMDNTPSLQKVVSKKETLVLSSSSSSSDSDSDSDSDEEDNSDTDVASQGPPAGTAFPPAKAIASTNILKRKTLDSSSEDETSSESESGSSSSSSSDSEARPSKKAKLESSSSSDTESDSSVDDSSASDGSSDEDFLEAATRTKLPSSEPSDASSSSDQSSDSASSDDESDGGIGTKTQSNGIAATEEVLSESSGTVIGDVKSVDVVLKGKATPNGMELTEVEQVVTTRKHIGAQPTRLAQLSAIANKEDYLSNDYVSYDYADRAYRDLVVTRGKGFTKEKNKKKRGSYRGGAIDTSGGKGFKFED